MESTKPFSR